MKTEKQKQNRKGYIFNGPEYSLMMKYSPKATKNKTIKFIPKNGKPFEVKTEELVELLAKHVNFETVAPAFIHNKKVEMVRVTRNITLNPNRDIKQGELVYIPFQHMMPIEFAIAEEALGVAKIDEKVKTINASQLNAAAKRITKDIEDYTSEQYKAFLQKQQENNPNSS